MSLFAVVKRQNLIFLLIKILQSVIPPGTIVGIFDTACYENWIVGIQQIIICLRELECLLKCHMILSETLIIKGFLHCYFYNVSADMSSGFLCLSNSVTYKKLRTTSFIEFTRIASSGSVSHNRVWVLSVPATSKWLSP